MGNQSVACVVYVAGTIVELVGRRCQYSPALLGTLLRVRRE